MKKVLLVAAIMALIICATATADTWRVDNNGNLTVDGDFFRVKGGSWFGLEGRHEPSNDQDNPSGAPMEMYIGNVFWNPTGRTYDEDIAEFKSLGFNLIRLPVAPQTLDPDDPQGKAPFLKNEESVRIENARLAMETVIQKLDDAGIYVLLDIHSCSNYVGWRAGRLDARPPYADADRDNYDFPREDCSCASTDNPSSVDSDKIQAYDESQWLDNLRELAGLADDLGVSNIMGIDIFNEPWDYTWSEWSSMIDKAYEAVNSVNSDILIFAQGISATAGNQDGNPDDFVDVPHGIEELNPNWGENLFEAGDDPPSMPKERLVYSPHTYGPSVFVQKMFMDPSQSECEGLEGDAAGDAECNIVINPSLLEQGWDEHFGYLKSQGYAVVIGEFGGNPDWPDGAEERMQDRYGYLSDKTVDWQWQEAFVDYLHDRAIDDSIYWSINPESGDTGGIFGHAYDPINNTGGWGTWENPESRRLNLLATLWDSPERTPVGGGSTAPPPTPTRTPVGTTPTPPIIIGDAVVFMNPETVNAGFEAEAVVNINVDSAGDNVAAYGIDITYDIDLIHTASDADVAAGDDGFVSAVNADTRGLISATGFDVNGVGPGANLNLLKITFTTRSTAGSASIGITVDTLTNATYTEIGNEGRGGAIQISDGMKGDVNGDGVITIVDALMVAQYSVGMNVPSTFNPGVADVDNNGTINIVDALMIAQAAVGIITL